MARMATASGLPEHAGDDPGHDEDPNDEALELSEEDRPRADRRRLPQFVAPVFLKPVRCILRGKPARRGIQLREYLIGGLAMPAIRAGEFDDLGRVSHGDGCGAPLRFNSKSCTRPLCPARPLPRLLRSTSWLCWRARRQARFFLYAAAIPPGRGSSRITVSWETRLSSAASPRLIFLKNEGLFGTKTKRG